MRPPPVHTNHLKEDIVKGMTKSRFVSSLRWKYSTDMHVTWLAITAVISQVSLELHCELMRMTSQRTLPFMNKANYILPVISMLSY